MPPTHSEILSRLDHERRYLCRHGDIIDVLPSITRLRAEDGSHHTVMFSALDEASADGAIAAEIEHHRAMGVPFEWKMYGHDQPTDLSDRLARHGLAIGPSESVMIFDLAAPPDWLNAEAAGRTIAVEREEHVWAFRQVMEAISGRSWAFTADQLSAALAAGSTDHRGYITYAGDVPVAAGRLYTHRESVFGGLYGGGTLPAYRGKGFYRALIAARARDALASGARYLLVDAMPTSAPILRRLGFFELTTTWPCDWKE